ncbi:MAG: GMC oxidoreductase [Thiobacillus sp.]|nr:GMC oxidoreductase [Thiobacillus sp.]
MKCVVVGSGPSGTNAALTLLRRGQSVEMWDTGRQETAFPHPEAGFHGLKDALQDPQEYFLGKRFEALLPPGSGELLRYPPARSFLVGADDPYWPYTGEDFKPFLSFSRGGLGVGWGANAVSYDDDDLRDWPIAFSDLEQAYVEACRRLPIAGPVDALSRYFPGVTPNQPPVRMNRHDARLLSSFTQHASRIERWSHIQLARARIAAVTAQGHPSTCRYCGRCLWGCPSGSLYDPARTTLLECQSHPQFTYKPGRMVLSLEAHDGRITGIRYRALDTGQETSESCDAVFLAAGALQSGGIFLRSLQRDPAFSDGHVQVGRTHSVLDTTVVKIPYIFLRQVGLKQEDEQFQYNRLIIAHRKQRADGWPMHCHGEVLSLNTLVYHPLIESIPLGSRLAMKTFARLHAALGVVTYFFPDRQVPGNGLSIIKDRNSPTGDRLRIHYQEAEEKQALIRETVNDTRRALLMLGCLPWQPQVVPAGGGIHYAGTVPMGNGPLCSDPTGRANAYRNLYLCDGATFPTLPSKSITFNLMANAIRVATLAEV